MSFARRGCFASLCRSGALVVALAGCTLGAPPPPVVSTPRIPQDGPPLSGIPDIASIPEPLPRFEPYCKPCFNAYQVEGVRYVPLRTAADYQERGVASWYGTKFQGLPTAMGESYEMFAFTAAHPTLPLPTYARVTNLDNGRSLTVRINDRGPFKKNRLIDLSYAAAVRLGVAEVGSALVDVRAIDPAHPKVEGPALAAQGNLYLQVGAFADVENARHLSRRLASSGFAPVAVQTAQLDQRAMHRVRIGPMSVELADRAATRLLAMGLATPQVIVE